MTIKWRGKAQRRGIWNRRGREQTDHGTRRLYSTELVRQPRQALIQMPEEHLRQKVQQTNKTECRLLAA